MKLSLRHFSKKDSTPNVLFIKKELLNLKKEGLAFFEEELSRIDENKMFEIYFHLHPGKRKDYNSFPMPKEVFTSIKRNNEKDFYCKMSKYYRKYYETDHFDVKLFNQYKKSPFIGRKYVWFYKSALLMMLILGTAFN